MFSLVGIGLLATRMIAGAPCFVGSSWEATFKFLGATRCHVDGDIKLASSSEPEPERPVVSTARYKLICLLSRAQAVFRKSLNEVVPFVTVSLGAHVNDEIHLGNGQFPVSWDELLEFEIGTPGHGGNS